LTVTRHLDDFHGRYAASGALVLLAELGEDVTPHQDDFHGRCLRGTRAVAELGEDGLGDGLRVGRERIQMQWSYCFAYSVGEFFYKSQ
jgi:hypothetical protein